VAQKPKLVLEPGTAAILVAGSPKVEAEAPTPVSGTRIHNPHSRALTIDEADFRYCVGPGTSQIDDGEVAKQLCLRAEKYGLKIL
jgi:hypothetical protein